jgi:hypothetical protein
VPQTWWRRRSEGVAGVGEEELQEAELQAGEADGGGSSAREVPGEVPPKQRTRTSPLPESHPFRAISPAPYGRIHEDQVGSCLGER